MRAHTAMRALAVVLALSPVVRCNLAHVQADGSSSSMDDDGLSSSRLPGEWQDNRKQFSFSHTTLDNDHNTYGVAYIKRGERDEARLHFQAATLHSPHHPASWRNLGLVNSELVETGLAPPKHRLRLLREALAAFEIVFMLGQDSTAQLQNTRKMLADMFPNKCEAANCNFALKLRQARQLMDKGRHEEAVNLMCTPGDLGFTLSDDEMRSGLPSPDTARNVMAMFRLCGVVVLQDIFPVDVMQSISDAHAQHLDAFLKANPTLVPHFETDTAAWRGDKRVEVKLPLEAPYAHPSFSANLLLLTFLKLLLGGSIEIDTFSTVTSLPGAPTQHWHADVDFLFKSDTASRRLPPQGIVVVAPLLDITEELGGTEFMLGSHVNLGLSHWSDQQDNPRVPLFAPTPSVGSAVLFDLRIRHRGLGNRSARPRPIFYVGIVHDWYRDAVNFKRRQSAAFDSFPDFMKKLFMRLDEVRYVQELERLVEKAGHNLDELRSGFEFKTVELTA